jgi:hypothetical protein
MTGQVDPASSIHMIHTPGSGKRVYRFTQCLAVFLILFWGLAVGKIQAAEPLNSINIYGGRMTSDHWEDVFIHTFDLNFVDSYFLAISMARKVGEYLDRMSFEIEGQLVKHFDYMDHWEFNGVLTGRWEKFPWDNTIDTSLAFGIGPSYATEEPQVEIDNNSETSKFLVYWMIELALGLPEYPQTELILRLHHRSDAWGLINEDGGSNGIGVGLKYKF